LLTAANTPLLVSFMSVVFLRVLLSFPTRRSSDLSGVTFLRPETSYLEASVEIAEGAMIYPGVTLLGKTKIGAGSVIESGCFLKNAIVEENVQILAHSYLEDATIQVGASIGPMARIRPQTIIGKKAKVGNFVEVKKSHLKDGAKVSHLSYVGDAEIGE